MKQQHHTSFLTPHDQTLTSSSYFSSSPPLLLTNPLQRGLINRPDPQYTWISPKPAFMTHFYLCLSGLEYFIISFYCVSLRRCWVSHAAPDANGAKVLGGKNANITCENDTNPKRCQETAAGVTCMTMLESVAVRESVTAC